MEKPLTIGCAAGGERNDIRLPGETAGNSPKHCTVELRGREIVLNNFSNQGIFVDEKQVHGSTILKLGQIIRIGAPGEHLQLISCIDPLTEK